jgi:hypothetical protein
MYTREQALYTLSQHYDLSLVYELEPNRTEFLVDLALECDLFCELKQASLHSLRTYASCLVGSNARRPELRMAKYEEALHNYLDWLVPEDEVEELEVTG